MEITSGQKWMTSVGNILIVLGISGDYVLVNRIARFIDGHEMPLAKDDRYYWHKQAFLNCRLMA